VVKAALVLGVAAALAVACSKDSVNPPDGFGVNVVIDAKGLAAGTRGKIARGVLTAQGPGTAPVVRPMAIDGAAINSGELRFRYIPASTTGMVSFLFEALDSAGEVIAAGRTASAITLVAGKAVSAVIVLAAGGVDGGTDAPTNQRKANGEPCQAAGECSSDFCVEGVCCNSACSGTCESCVAGQRGRCDPVPDGTDPKMQCGPAPAPDAGAPGENADGGDAGPDDGGIQAPDGGFQGSNLQCAGTCNGMRACRYPGTEKSCGNKWCNSADEVGAMTCDGQGACGPQISGCVDYACADGACKTRCAAHEDCQPDKTYCNAANQCAPKKGDGLVCVTGDECRSGHCAGSVSNKVCCNSACDAPFTCTETPGKCKCPGVNCAPDVPCQVFYRDADGDGAGDKFGTLAIVGGNGNAQAACADAPPAGFVANNTDCDDGDANAKPGQTAFFDVPSRVKGTYDYDCDGNIAKGTLENLGSTCYFCTQGDTLFSCGKPAYTCASKGQVAGQSCSVQCTGGSRGSFFFCSCQPNDGFISTVDCGVEGDFKICGSCADVGQYPSYPYSYKRKQNCR
jgi:hypothetical protein